MSAFDVNYTYQKGFEDGFGQKKELFIEGVKALQEYFERKECLKQAEFVWSNPCEDKIIEVLVSYLNDGKDDWDYDSFMGVSWITHWASYPVTIFVRGDYFIKIANAQRLYEFISEMSEFGWPEEVPQKWIY